MWSVSRVQLKLKYTAITAMAGGLLLGCENPREIESHNSLVYCSEGSPETFNPQLITSGTTIDATSRQLYDRLLEIDAKTQQLAPGLAVSWQVSEDGKKYTFQLRKGVTFHHTAYFKPTRDFNADDIVFSYNRWKEYDHPFHKVNGGLYPYFQSLGLDLLVRKIYKTSDYEVVIELNKARGSFLANLATDFSVIHSAEYGQQLLHSNELDYIDSRPVGTGPFKFKSYKKGRVIRYQKHHDYWRDNTNIEDVIFDITKSDHLRLAKLLTKECDVIGYPLTSELGVIRDSDRLSLQEQVGLNVGYWAFNTQKEPFNNVLVRQALARAIDVDTILKAVYFNTANRASNILPPSSWAYAEQLGPIEFSPEKAKQLLIEAGYEKGFTMDIWAMPVQRPYNPNAKKMAQLIQSNLKAIGVTANIVSYDWSVFREKVANGEHDTVLMGWTADNADPDNFFTPLLSCAAARSGSNRALWCNREFDRVIRLAKDEFNEDMRKIHYFKAQQYVLTQLPLLPIAHANRYQAQQNNVKGLGIMPYGGIDLSLLNKESK